MTLTQEEIIKEKRETLITLPLIWLMSVICELALAGTAKDQREWWIALGYCLFCGVIQYIFTIRGIRLLRELREMPTSN